MTNLQMFLSMGVPTLAVLIGFLFSNQRFNSLDAKIVAVEVSLGGRIDRIENRLSVIEADLRQFYRDLGAHEAEISNLKLRFRSES
jgi:hypothetical protein